MQTFNLPEIEKLVQADEEKKEEAIASASCVSLPKLGIPDMQADMLAAGMLQDANSTLNDGRSMGSLTRDPMDSDGDSEDDVSSAANALGKQDIPVIPPRGINQGFSHPSDERDRARWFRIMSPRELKGIDGPYSEGELRHMYKKGELGDDTMMWSEGQRDWEQLLFLKELRPRLLQVRLYVHMCICVYLISL